MSQAQDFRHNAEYAHHGGFDDAQAAMLHDLARNGHDDGEQMYEYGGMNGFSGEEDNSDELSPAALLESLANFEHPVPIHESTANHGDLGHLALGRNEISTDHFASLLQAAAASAGGQEVELAGEARRSTKQPQAANSSFGFVDRQETPRQRGGRRSASPQTFVLPRNSKRKRNVDPAEEEEQLAREREIWGPEEDEDQELGETSVVIYSGHHLGAGDARAAGVHSAAALFRRPTRASKKYTRPPMSKLFTSLELSPEDFLHLQAAAKAYMLDPDHPERRSAVGNRGKGDTDMVKLKLFGCVRGFLEDEGIGDRYFGSGSEQPESRRLLWPAHKSKIIALVTPLLRRMVTNERQREYANDSRRLKAAGNKRRPSSNDKSMSVDNAADIEVSTPAPRADSQYLAIDPKLNQYHYDLTTPFPESVSSSAQQVAQQPDNTDSTMGTTFHISILQPTTANAQSRIRPKLTLTPQSCPGFPSLVQHVHNLIGHFSGDAPGENAGAALKLQALKVLGPEGLVNVDSDESWQEAVSMVQEREWMDGQLRVVVEVSSAGEEVQ